MLGLEIDEVTINRDLCCEPHVDHNGGKSFIAFFCDYTGGQLCFEYGKCVGGPGDRGKWHCFDGCDLHWNMPHFGSKLTVVAYPKTLPCRPL